MRKYQKIIIYLVAAVILIGTAWGFKRRRVELITPDRIISLNEAIGASGAEALTDGEVKKIGNRLEVCYNANPIGSADNVKVELVYYSDEYPRSSVEELFNSDRDRLLIYEEISNMGERAFIAFPSIYIYEKGFYVKITAGSASDDTQAEILKKLGQTAAENLEKYIKSNRLK